MAASLERGPLAVPARLAALLRAHPVASRLLQLIPLLIVISFISFAMMRVAGSDAVLQKMENTGMAVSPAVVARARAELGVDKPFPSQYVAWLSGVLRGDMGVSYVSGKPVLATFASKLPATLLLAALSIALTVVVSIPLGVLAAVRRGRAADRIVRALSFIGGSMPNFLVALLLMYLFAIRLGVLPVMSREVGITGAVLPALTLAIAMSAKYVRQVRAAVLGELGREYVTGAAARGVGFSVTLVASVLRTCFVQIATLLMLSVGSLLGGAAVVESIFMWDGVGKMAVDAIQMRDYPVIQAYVMWMAIIYVVANLLADLMYRALDPRIRLGGEGA